LQWVTFASEIVRTLCVLFRSLCCCCIADFIQALDYTSASAQAHP